MILEQCKGVHCVDLGESFQTHIFLQNFASIQPLERALLSLPDSMSVFQLRAVAASFALARVKVGLEKNSNSQKITATK